MLSPGRGFGASQRIYPGPVCRRLLAQSSFWNWKEKEKKTKQNPLMFRAVCVLEEQWWLFFQIVKVWNEGGCSCLIGFFFCILYGKPVYLPHNHFYTLDSTSPSKWAGKRLTGSLFSRKYSYHLFLKKKNQNTSGHEISMWAYFV